MSNRRGTVEDSSGCCHGVRPYEALYNALVGRCKRRGRKVMSFRAFLTFTKITKCSYCGGSIIWARRMNHDGQLNAGSNLDRVNTKKGYTKDNCVVCCGECNHMKWDMTREEFIEKILLLASRIRRGEL